MIQRCLDVTFYATQKYIKDQNAYALLQHHFKELFKYLNQISYPERHWEICGLTPFFQMPQ